MIAPPMTSCSGSQPHEDYFRGFLILRARTKLNDVQTSRPSQNMASPQYLAVATEELRVRLPSRSCLVGFFCSCVTEATAIHLVHGDYAMLIVGYAVGS
jgi:hypothetical protein